MLQSFNYICKFDLLQTKIFSIIFFSCFSLFILTFFFRIFSHPNVMPVIGCCNSPPNLVVISQLMPIGSLYQVPIRSLLLYRVSYQIKEDWIFFFERCILVIISWIRFSRRPSSFETCSFRNWCSKCWKMLSKIGATNIKNLSNSELVIRFFFK